MAAIIIDGKTVAQQVRVNCRVRAEALHALGIHPGLAVVMVGDNSVSSAYVNSKVRACGEVGVHSEVHRLPRDVTDAGVLAIVDRLNRDSNIHGIIVQLPLPAHLTTASILQCVAVDKDVDGFNWRNLGALVDGQPGFVPCTPLGVIALLDHAGVEMEGRNAVVVGRSSIVGKPLAMLLLSRNATVTVCHSRTRDLARVTSGADILVAAVGRPGLISGDMIKPGAAVVDVGINRLPDGRLTGDVDGESARNTAGWLTPVPGGVGPMTVAMLIANTLAAAERNTPAARGRSSAR